MKTKSKLLIMLSLLCLILSVQISAQEGMPPMGAPEQIKALSWLVGEWDIDQKFLMSDTADIWEESKATAKYYYSLDGCVLMMDYVSEFMNMPFTGHLFQTFDRMTGKYQSVWVDNMGARISYYEGVKDGNSMVSSGDEFDMTGKPSIGRITTYNETPESFDWKVETSKDGGKTFIVTGHAKYTKKK